jgi:hypothetical protein
MPAERDLLRSELVEALLLAGQVAQAAAIAEEVLNRGHDSAIDWPMRFKLPCIVIAGALG